MKSHELGTAILKASALLLSAVLSLFPAVSQAQSTDQKPIKIGILSDMSGPYADQAGVGSVEAAKMAIEDIGGKIGNRTIELVSADHQHKTDVALGIVRRWFDIDGVDVVADMPNSGVALAVQQLTRERNKIALFATAATTELTGKQCSPNGIQWVYDAYSNAAGLAKALIKQGQKSWYFITVDYALGQSLELEASKAIRQAGGSIVGAVRHPLNTADFSSYLVHASETPAQVIALANAGADTINSLKQAKEFGLMSKPDRTLVTPLVYISDIHSLGLDLAGGLTFVEGFYWDLDDQTRAWSKRFFDRRGAMPTMTHAGVYSQVRHYLQAVRDAGTTDSQAVLAKMRATPVNDFFSHGGQIRPDGRMVHDMLLVQVKRPNEQKYPWDYYKVLTVIPGAEAFRPLSESECPLVR
ncbi:MAG: branched-chain amino acid transport system substrate-binding protein [Methylobacteriaceae bacterium]|nr:branched-chain amino acid transport system substrate-binding protein [Methylobacteriaceae bacterium]